MPPTMLPQTRVQCRATRVHHADSGLVFATLCLDYSHILGLQPSCPSQPQMPLRECIAHLI